MKRIAHLAGIALALAVLLLCPVSSLAQQTNTLDTLQAALRAKQAEIETASVKAGTDALTTYGTAIETTRKARKDAGDLDAVLALDTELKRFAADKTIPEADKAPATLAGAVAAYRKTIADAETAKTKAVAALLTSYVKSLDSLVKRLTQQEKLEDAKKAKDEKTKAEFMLADAETKTPKADDAARPVLLADKPSNVATSAEECAVLFNGREGADNPGWKGVEGLAYQAEQGAQTRYARTKGKVWLRYDKPVDLAKGVSVLILCKYHGGDGSLVGKAREDMDIFSLVVFGGKLGVGNNWRPMSPVAQLLGELERDSWFTAGMTSSKDDCTVFLNKKVLGKIEKGRIPSANMDGYFEIGVNSPGGDEYVDMTIGTVRIYSEKLSPMRMQAEMGKLMASVKK